MVTLLTANHMGAIAHYITTADSKMVIDHEAIRSIVFVIITLWLSFVTPV